MRPLPVLDERLAAAFSLFPACDRGADIGADHGRLSCCLLASGRVQHMVVSDVSADSLQKARALLQIHEQSAHADFVVADGLQALSSPVDALAICGMGGATAAKILLAAPEKLGNAQLILSAHTDMPLLRGALVRLGYQITEEVLVRAKGRFYIVLKAKRGEEPLSAQSLYLGPRLMEGASELYLRYLKWRFDVLSCMQGAQAAQQRQWIEEEIKRVSACCPKHS